MWRDRLVYAEEKTGVIAFFVRLLYGLSFTKNHRENWFIYIYMANRIKQRFWELMRKVHDE